MTAGTWDKRDDGGWDLWRGPKGRESHVAAIRLDAVGQWTAYVRELNALGELGEVARKLGDFETMQHACNAVETELAKVAA